MGTKNNELACDIIANALDAEREKRRRLKRLRKVCSRIMRFLLSTVGLIALNAVIIVVGAYTFQHLEEINEIEMCYHARHDYHMAENETLLLLMNATRQLQSLGNISDNVQADFQQDVKDLLKSYALSALGTKYNITVSCEDMGKHNGTELKWSLAGSFLFAATVITTIGELSSPSSLARKGNFR